MKILAQELEHRAAIDRQGVAVVDAKGSHTLGELVDAARAMATAISNSAKGPPTLLVRADNSWRTLTAATAVGMCGGVISVISHHATPQELALAIEDVQPDALVAAPSDLAGWGIDAAVFVNPTPVLDGWTLVARSGAMAGVDRWGAGSVIATTSGSTGRPKSVVQSEGALRYAITETVTAVGLAPRDTIGALVPLSSVAAFCFGMYLPAMLGATQVCLDKWQPRDALDLLDAHQVAWTMLVPTMAFQLSLEPRSQGRLRSMKAMTVGGGPMNAAALQRAEEALGTTFLRVFGMSECLGHTTSLPSDPPAVRLDTDGRPFPGTVHRIVDDNGDALTPGAVGHVQVRGPSMFVGYAREGRPQPRDLAPGGFMATGDLGTVREDGTIQIVGRDKQIIIRGGRNIDINEVEAAVASLPDVAQVCVVPVPDEMLGERVAALIVSTAPLSLSDVQRGLDEKGIPKAKWPEFVHRLPQLPQNRIGKLNRVEATALATRLSPTGQAGETP